MDIWMIWATCDGVTWLVEAWDDDSRQENLRGWEAKLAKARAQYGADNVVVLTTGIDFDAVVAAFEPASVPNDGAIELIERLNNEEEK